MSEDKPPLHMRLFRIVGLQLIDFDFASDWKRAKAGETWLCVMGSLFGRGVLIPVRKRQ
jgi:hypothetical protein